jgi:hypothetical protein
MHSVTPPHPTLAAPSTVSVGDPNKVPPSSSWPIVECHEALVLGELVEETPEKESMQEAPTTHPQEVPTMKA